MSTYQHKPTCPACSAPILSREWHGEIGAVDCYSCGSVWRRALDGSRRVEEAIACEGIHLPELVQPSFGCPVCGAEATQRQWVGIDHGHDLYDCSAVALWGAWPEGWRLSRLVRSCEPRPWPPPKEQP